MNPQAMTLEQIREQGLAVLRKHLGGVGMVRFLQQAEMGRAIIRKNGINGWAIQTLKSWRKSSRLTIQTVQT